MLLLHGFTGSPRAWDDVAERCPEASGALRPALHGHGAPEEDVARSFDEELDRIAAMIAPSSPVHLAGYSLGARVALGLLARHPASFSGATLIGVHPGLEAERERAERRASDEVWARRIEHEGVARFTEAWEAQPLFASQKNAPASRLAAQDARRRQHRPEGLASSLRTLGLGAMPCYLPVLGAIRVPVALVCGELDAKFRALAERMCGVLPRGSLTVVAGSGHNLLLEAPEAVAGLLSAKSRTVI